MSTKPNPQPAMLCLALAGILLFGALACGLPVATVTETPASLPATIPPNQPPAAVQPAAQTNTTLPPPPAPTAAEARPEVSQVQIYLVALGDGGASGRAVGCGDSLVAVSRQIAPTRQPIVAALNELFSIKEQTFGQSGLYNALYQSALRVESAEVDANHIATVVLTGQVMMGGECDTPRFKDQIEQTILGVGGIQSANILLNGKTIDQALSLK